VKLVGRFVPNVRAEDGSRLRSVGKARFSFAQMQTQVGIRAAARSRIRYPTLLMLSVALLVSLGSTVGCSSRGKLDRARLWHWPVTQPQTSTQERAALKRQTAAAEGEKQKPILRNVIFQGAPADVVLEGIAQEYGVQMVFLDRPTKPVSVHLTDAPLDKALAAVLASTGFLYEVKDDIIYIMSGNRQVTRVYRLRFGFPSSVLESLKSGGESIAVGVDSTSGAVVVSGPIAKVREIGRILQELDHPRPQVMIEARIYEISTERIRELGLSLAWSQSKTDRDVSMNTPFNLDPQKTLLNFTKLAPEQMEAILNSVGSTKDVRLLSAPRIVAMDGVAAKILVGEKVPYVRRSTETVSGGLMQEVEFVDVGIKLDVTPRINPQTGQVTMTVHPEVSEVLDKQVQGVPRIGTREASTRVTIRDGQTLVIGGLMRHNVRHTGTTLPYIGEIPPFSWILGDHSRENNQTELLVFITPHIVRDSDVKISAEKADYLRRTW